MILTFIVMALLRVDQAAVAPDLKDMKFVQLHCVNAEEDGIKIPLVNFLVAYICCRLVHISFPGKMRERRQALAVESNEFRTDWETINPPRLLAIESSCGIT